VKNLRMPSIFDEYNSVQIRWDFLLQLQENYSLQKHNTLGLDVRARYLVVARNKNQLAEAIEFARERSVKVLVLGGGSNIVFTGDFDGLVLMPDIRGVDTSAVDVKSAHPDFQQLVIGAGENWHGLVRRTLEMGFSGLENLSMIPGLAGASPIQNIGAYGQELEKVFIQLEAMDAATGEELIFDHAGCEFGYRQSIFKTTLRDRLVITSITLALSKEFIPILGYKDLGEELDRGKISALTAVDVSNAVMAIRSRKLPDPMVLGNVGSFFKNPDVSLEQFEHIKKTHSSVPSRQQDDSHFKIPAAWLIEEAGMKGVSVGDAMVSEQHALVIVNRGNASPEDISALSKEIEHRIHDQFGISLDMEPVRY
jgi:UDP-N-acetylmuramate dehydrogenase